MKLNWELLPGHIRKSVKFYLEEGILPGSFLRAVICNDLKEAFAQADTVNRERLFDIVTFFYNYMPGNSWGSPEKMKKWIATFEEA
jgi:hypothetical protein